MVQENMEAQKRKDLYNESIKSSIEQLKSKDQLIQNLQAKMN